jgi:holliday junction resolvase
MPSTGKGVRGERELINLLWSHGYAALRAPASGAASRTPRPDILAGNSKLRRHLAFELKVTHKKSIYVSKDQIAGLAEFAKRFGCRPYLGVKFTAKRQPWIFIPVKLLRSASNSFKVTPEIAAADGLSLENVLGKHPETSK